jgi:hypothetical protein
MITSSAKQGRCHLGSATTVAGRQLRLPRRRPGSPENIQAKFNTNDSINMNEIIDKVVKIGKS